MHMQMTGCGSLDFGKIQTRRRSEKIANSQDGGGRDVCGYVHLIAGALFFFPLPTQARREPACVVRARGRIPRPLISCLAALLRAHAWGSVGFFATLLLFIIVVDEELRTSRHE